MLSRRDGIELRVCRLSILVRDLGDSIDAYIKVPDIGTNHDVR